MAFFASSATLDRDERKLKRTVSSDRMRRSPHSPHFSQSSPSGSAQHSSSHHYTHRAPTLIESPTDERDLLPFPTDIMSAPPSSSILTSTSASLSSAMAPLLVPPPSKSSSRSPSPARSANSGGAVSASTSAVGASSSNRQRKRSSPPVVAAGVAAGASGSSAVSTRDRERESGREREGRSRRLTESRAGAGGTPSPVSLSTSHHSNHSHSLSPSPVPSNSRSFNPSPTASHSHSSSSHNHSQHSSHSPSPICSGSRRPSALESAKDVQKARSSPDLKDLKKEKLEAKSIPGTGSSSASQGGSSGAAHSSSSTKEKERTRTRERSQTGVSVSARGTRPSHSQQEPLPTLPSTPHKSDKSSQPQQNPAIVSSTSTSPSSSSSVPRPTTPPPLPSPSPSPGIVRSTSTSANPSPNSSSHILPHKSQTSPLPNSTSRVHLTHHSHRARLEDFSSGQSHSLSAPHGRTYKSSGTGSASEGSVYGVPISISMSMKRLLSKPASPGMVPSDFRAVSTMSNPSDSEQLGFSMRSRRRVETSDSAQSAPSDAVGLTYGNGMISLPLGTSSNTTNNTIPRKPSTSNPEPPNSRSVGRAKGIEMSRTLEIREREREREREKEREKRAKGTASAPERPTHTRSHSSSFSLSPSSPEPFAIRPPIQLHLMTSGFGGETRRASAVGLSSSNSPSLSTSPVVFSNPFASQKESPVAVTTTSASHQLTAPSSSVRHKSSPRHSPHSPHSQTGPPPSQSASIARSASASAGIVARREDSPPPSGLTPAEIVAHAYKQQERRREELTRGAAFDAEITSEQEYLSKKERERKSRKRGDSNANVSGNGRKQEGDVLNASSGKVVAMGSLEDGSWSATVRQDKSPEPPMTLRRKISKKMSGKFRREGSTGTDLIHGMSTLSSTPAATTSVIPERIEPRERRPSLNINLTLPGRRSATMPRERKGSLKLSLDSYVAVQSTEPHSGMALPSAGNGIPEKGFMYASLSAMAKDRETPSPFTTNSAPVTSVPGTWTRGEDRSLSESLTTPLSAREIVTEKVNGKERGHGQAEGSPTGTRLWKLVKRISSTALKEKFSGRGSSDDYHHHNAPLPPLPPLPSIPRDVGAITPLPARFTYERDNSGAGSPHQRSDKPSSKETHKGVSPIAPSPVPPSSKGSESLGNSNTVRASSRSPCPVLSYGRPSTAPTLMSAALDRTPGSSTKIHPGLSKTDNRPSTTTRSSSPISSDIASSTFFNRTQSNRSSTSSFDEMALAAQKEKTREQKVYVAQHILPPEKLRMFDIMGVDIDPLADDDDENPSVSTHEEHTTSHPYSYFDEEAVVYSLPVPPRRFGGKHGQRTDGSMESSPESPSIPTFTTENAVNTFGHRSAARAGAGMASELGHRTASSGAGSVITADVVPPPRPPRSVARRTAATNLFFGSPPNGVDSDSNTIFPSGREHHKASHSRGSIGALSQASTARPDALELGLQLDLDVDDGSSPLDSLSPASDVSPVTFRSMDSTQQKQTWSEQEKLDKWNALLDKSEKAGGTLYIGLGGLLSDSIRDGSVAGF